MKAFRTKPIHPKIKLQYHNFIFNFHLSERGRYVGFMWVLSHRIHSSCKRTNKYYRTYNPNYVSFSFIPTVFLKN